MKDGDPGIVRLADYRPAEWLVDHVELRFDLAPHGTRVHSRLRLRRNPASTVRGALRLDGEGLELEAIRLDGEPLSSNAWSRDAASLTVHNPPDACVLEVTTRIDPADNTALEGLYRSGGMYCTQCEPEGFRRITYYPDRPDVLARFRTTLVADPSEYPDLLANGNEVAREALADGRIAVTWDDPFPKPAYLFALVAGKLAMIRDTFTTMGGRAVELRIYSEPHNIDQCQWAMQCLKDAMRWDEQVFGREYDLDIFMIVAVDFFNMGAMENKGLNIFNTSCVLAHPRTTTDAGFARVQGVVAHEYFHNWSGNRVTCRDWFQLSLEEGFTVYRDAEFSADMGSATVKRVESVNLLRTVQFPEDAGPMAHPIRPSSYIEINNFYTPTVYEKGAEVVRMLRTLLGARRFRAGSDLYFDRHDGQAVTTDDFVRAMEEANGVDLAQFRRWYDHAGTPVLAISEQWAPGQGVWTLTVAQRTPATPGQPDKPPFHIPLAIGLLGADGREISGAAGERQGVRIVATPADRVENPDGDGTLILHVTEPVQQFAFAGLENRPVVSLLRGFSAPVRIEFERHPDDWVLLMLHDTDGFARWDAAQAFASAQLGRMIAGTVADATGVPAALVDALRLLAERALKAPDDGEARALYAAMLALPAESWLADQAAQIDPDAIHQCRERARTHLAVVLHDLWERLYVANAATGPYAPDAAGMARRALRNTALAYLSLVDEPAAIDRLTAQLAEADNMTDRMAALRELVHSPLLRSAAAREQALAAFLAAHAGDALVVDQWFSVQATRPRPGTLATVQALEEHPAFDTRNPNKLRALYGAFGGQNLVEFHRLDGSGYRFLAERVIRLNATNPQVAARLLTPLTRWQRYAPERQRLMRAALEQLQARPDLSPNVYEVVVKSLAEPVRD